MTAEKFIDTFKNWSANQQDIDSVVLVGSYAQGKAKKDSDIDLIILTDKPELFLNDDNWIKELGEVNEIKKEDYQAVQVIRVFYQNGLEVEFGITVPVWASINPLDEGTKRVITGGSKILVDKNGLLKVLTDTVQP